MHGHRTPRELSDQVLTFTTNPVSKRLGYLLSPSAAIATAVCVHPRLLEAGTPPASPLDVTALAWWSLPDSAAAILALGVVCVGLFVFVPTRVGFRQQLAAWRLRRAWRKLCFPARVHGGTTIRKGLLALEEKGDRQRARRIWEAAQRRHPADYRLAHSLALLNYWEMASDNPHRCGETLVRAAVGNWVFLVNCEPFWRDWNTKRPSSSFIPETLREELTKAIERAVPNSHANILLLERKTADLLGELAEWGKRKGLSGQILRAGPCFLSAVNATSAVQKIVKSALEIEPNNRSLRLLKFCLSPVGIPAVLVASDRVDEALEALTRVGENGQTTTSEFVQEFADNIIHWSCQPADVEGRVERLQKAVKVVRYDALTFAFHDAVRELHISHINGIYKSLYEEDQPEEADRRLKRLIALRQQWKLPQVDGDAEERLSQLQQIVPEAIRFGSEEVFTLCMEARKAASEERWGDAKKFLERAHAVAKPGKALQVDKEMAACLCAEAIEKANPLLKQASAWAEKENEEKVRLIVSELKNGPLAKLKTASHQDPSSSHIKENLKRLEDQVEALEDWLRRRKVGRFGGPGLPDISCPNCGSTLQVRTDLQTLYFNSSRLKWEIGVKCDVCGWKLDKFPWTI